VKLGRRRRTKVRTRPRPKLPNIFDCPLCSKKAVSITFDKDQNIFDFECTNCGKRYHYSNPTNFPVKFGCPSCNTKSAVVIEFVETTNSVQIHCEECGKSTYFSAKQLENDPEAASIINFPPKPAKLGCPNCGFRTIKMSAKLRKEYARVQCGACFIRDSYSITSLDEKVDVYGKFVDNVRADLKAIEEFGPEEALKDPIRAERYKNVRGVTQKEEEEEKLAEEELFDEEPTDEDTDTTYESEDSTEFEGFGD
jgi:transcription elongation factor Elf1